MGRFSLKRALTPPKWLRDSTGLSTSQILNVVSPSGTLNSIVNANSDNVGAVVEARNNEQSKQLMLIGGIAVAYYLFK